MVLRRLLFALAALSLPWISTVSCNGTGSAPAFLCEAKNGSTLFARVRRDRLRVPALFPKVETLWQTTSIPVCWDDAAMATVSDDDREIVHQAVEETWNLALADPSLPAEIPHFQFTGFNPCSQDPDAAANGVHISWTTGQPYTIALGQELKGQPGGMALNFTFKEWSSKGCHDFNVDDVQRRYCVYSIAVHEFGHAMGIAHEQNRTDTPLTCKEAPQGETGDIALGKWDSDSVMNYCNPSWDNAGILSPNDQSGIRTLYYPQQAQDWCNGQGKPLPTPDWPTPTPQKAVSQ